MSNSPRGRRSKVRNEAKEKEQGGLGDRSRRGKTTWETGRKGSLHKLTSDDRRRIAQKAAAVIT